MGRARTTVLASGLVLAAMLTPGAVTAYAAPRDAKPALVRPASVPPSSPKSVPLGPVGASDVVIDDADQYIFVSEATANAVEAFDRDGTLLTTFTGISAASSMVLQGGTLYVLEPTSGVIEKIDTATLADEGKLVSGLSRLYGLAFAGGVLWTSVQQPQGYSYLTSISTAGDPTAFDNPIIGSLDLATAPALPDALFAGAHGSTPGQFTRFDVSGGTPSVVATNTNAPQENTEGLAVSPDGTRVIPVSGFPYALDELSATTLQPDGVVYPGDTYPSAVAVSPGEGGIVASGLDNGYSAPDISIEKLGSTTPLFTATTNSPGGTANVVQNGLALSADGGLLVAVTIDPYPSQGYTLHIYPTGLGPKSTTAVSASPSGPAIVGTAVTFTATVTSSDSQLTPTGQVTFTDNGSTIGTSSLDGEGHAFVTTSALPPGTQAIAASYSGDSDLPVSAASLAYTVSQSAGTFVSVAPTRLLDTRSGNGATGPVAPMGTVKLRVTGRGPVPASGVSAVVLNLTATAPKTGGFVTAYPDGTARPTASNLNFVGNQTVPNLAVVRVGTDGVVDLYNGSSGSVQLIADVSGYYVAGTATEPGTLVSSSPVRLLDTRRSSGPIRAGGTKSLHILGVAPVPARNVSAVVLNVTVTGPTSRGFLTVYPGARSRPTASNLNFVTGQTVPNLVTVPVGGDGSVDFYNGSAGTMQVVVDIAGYYNGGTASDVGAFVATVPTRLMDTRYHQGWTGPATAAESIPLTAHGAGPVPSSPVSAVVVNVTVNAPTKPGYLTVYGDGSVTPTASNLNFVAGQTVPNLAVAPVGPDGKVAIFNDAGTSQVIVDVSGYFIGCASCGAPSFRAAQAPAAAGTTGQALNDIKCWGAGSCIAVGEDNNGQHAVADTLSGGSWTSARLPLPGNANPATPEVLLYNVACPVAGTCVSTGSYKTSAGSIEALVETLSSGTWTAVEAALPSNASTAPAAWLFWPSCPTTGYCVAVGGYTDKSGHDQGLIETIDNGHFTATEMPVPYNAATNPGTDVAYVTCAAAFTCQAVGSYANNSGLTNGMLVSTTGSGWSANEAPLPSDSYNGSGYLDAVVCSSPTTCIASGAYSYTSNRGPGLIEETTDGSDWNAYGTPLPVNGVSNPTGSLDDVACFSASSCIAVGFMNDGLRHGQPYAVRVSGSTLTNEHVQLPAGAAANPKGVLESISCTTASGTCMAFGQYVAAGGHQRGLIASRAANGTWTTMPAPLPAGANSSLDQWMYGMQCVEPRSCIAVGTYNTSSSGTTSLGFIDTSS